MTRQFPFLLIVLLASAALAQTPAAAPTTQPISGKLGTPFELFDGKDLTGWAWVPQQAGAKIEDTWTIKDGAMHSTGKPTGYIRTDKVVGPNFVLIVEQRHLEKGGGGILIGITGPDKVWPPNLQVQGTLGDVGDLINMGNFKWTVDQKRYKKRATDELLTKMGPTSEKPMGEFYPVVTIVENGRVSTEVNGKLQNIATDMPDLSGKIGFQCEGASQEFRKVTVIPIEPK